MVAPVDEKSVEGKNSAVNDSWNPQANRLQFLNGYRNSNCIYPRCNLPYWLDGTYPLFFGQRVKRCREATTG